MEGVGPKPTRKCIVCGFESEDMVKFVKDKGSKYGRRNNCAKCYQAANKMHPSYKISQTRYQGKKRYGIDVDTYLERMSTSQCCEICSRKEELCYDHCHETLAFRGVLCRKCNSGIGLLGDTAEDLQRAVNYLQRPPRKDEPLD